MNWLNLDSSAKEPGKENPTKEDVIRLLENHHGYDVAMDRNNKTKIRFESTTSCTRVLQDAGLGFMFYRKSLK